MTEVPWDDSQFHLDLQRFGYPFPRTVEDLSGSTVFHLSRESTVGYIWFEPMSPVVADFHILITPDHRRRWLNRRIIAGILNRIAQLGYQTVIFDPLWSSHARFIERLGFDKVGPFYLWRPNEFQEAQSPSCSTPAASGSDAGSSGVDARSRRDGGG